MTESLELSCAKKFGWKEIPFEPLGVDSGKYPIIRAEDFDELQKAAKVAKLEKKFDIKLLRAPQGAGKTALSNEIKNTFLKDSEAFVIFNQLTNMKPNELTKQIIKQAVQTDSVTENFVTSLGYSNDNQHTSAELKEFIIKIFEKAIERKDLGLWIVDEFDTIASDESSEGVKSEFLQWLRSIIDAIANSEKIHGKGFLMIMAHTEKSAEQFGKELHNLHGPLHERLMGTGTIEIGYTLAEVKKIIQIRINSVQIDQKNTSIESFTEQAIETLYELVNYETGTREMTSFRLFEKSCYVAILNACDQNQLIVGIPEIESAFKEIKKTLFPKSVSTNISHETTMDISKILRANENAQNTTILSGISHGISNFMDAYLDSVVNIGSKSIEITENGLHINEIRFNTELKLKKSSISSIWYCVSKDKESFVDEDYEFIESTLKSLENERFGINLTILCLVTDKEDVEIDNEFVKEKIKSVDEIFLIDKRLKKDLISLGCCNQAEIIEFQIPFDRNINSTFTNLLSNQVRDITFKPSEGVKMLIRMLNLLFNIDENTSGSQLTIDTGIFFGKTKPQPKAVNEMIQLGFAKDTTDSLIPEIPRSLQHILDLIKKENRTVFDKVPNKDVIFNIAKDLDLIDEENNVVQYDDIVKLISEPIEQSKNILEDSEDDDRKIMNDMRKLIKSYDNLDSISNPILKTLLIQFILRELKERLLKVKKNISTSSQSQTTTKEDNSTTHSTSEKLDDDQNAENVDIVPDTKKDFKDSSDPDVLLEDIRFILSSGPLSFTEVYKKLQDDDYSPDVRRKLDFLIKKGQIKVTM